MAKSPIGKAGPVPLSPGWRAGDFVFTSGQVPADDQGNIVNGGIEDQTRAVMRRIEAILKEAGCGFEDVIKTTVWIEDARDFARFNKVYAEYFPTNPPARSTVEARLMIDAKIEIEAIAYKPAS
ncbi:MAG: RidA family protein [Geminicoccaceae bacterium]|nr:MAG: RidA family protein [Geminicoccaceae bacterium]